MTEPAWTRATTVANTLADRYGLERWAQRNTVLGLGAREDLYAQAASCTPDDKDELNRIVDQAQEAARAQAGANLGSALHRFAERIDRGEDVRIPDQWAPDIDAYRAALDVANVAIVPGYVERVVVIPQLKVAGTLDRMVTVNGDGPYIADLKTGQDVIRYGMAEIALQLALYAGATHAWKGTTDDIRRDRWGRYLLPDPADEPDAYEPMPDVSRSRAVVIHLPVGQARCDLHWVDIDAGRHAVRKAMWVRDWRKRKNLSTPITVERRRQEAANF